MADASERPKPRKLAKVLRDFRAICRENGYALAEHGTKQRDYDLIAVPWTPKAIASGDLLKRLGTVKGVTYQSNPTGKPHGRIGATFLRSPFDPDESIRFLDVSVCPRQGDW